MRSIRKYFYAELARIREKVLEYTEYLAGLLSHQIGLRRYYDMRLSFTYEADVRIGEICDCIDAYLWAQYLKHFIICMCMSVAHRRLRRRLLIHIAFA